MTATLADIVPLTETVVIRERALEVSGIDIEHIVPLILRFPDLRKIFSGDAEVVASLLPQARELHAALIAAGLGKYGDEAEERGIYNLNLGERMTLSNAVLRLTGGLGPFFELLEMSGLGAADPVAEETAAKPLPPGAIKFRRRGNGLLQSESTAS